MAQERDLRIEEMEEQLRREMPLLDVPETLSAQNVAAALREKKAPRKTPIYVWVRSAVAAALVLAVGIGALKAAGIFGRKKEAMAPEAMKEEAGGSAYYNADDGDTDGYYPEESAVPSYAYNKNDAVAEAADIYILAPGETAVIGTGVSFDGAVMKYYRADETDAGSIDDICKVKLVKDEYGDAQLELSAVSPGNLTVELI
ncbi:MAG: hypothetical protein J6U30_04140 [Oscillospiraceae bacterium]|nr:hypothetical protein [Oscillospiraceae bacterium]